MNASRTIFITSFHPLISRNIVATPIPRALADAGCHVVILVPSYKKEYFRERYSAPHVTIEGVDVSPAVRTRRVRMFKRLTEAIPNTERAAIGRKRTLSGTMKTPLYYYLFYVPVGILGKFLWFHRLVRFADYHFSPKGRFTPLIARYEPSLIFSTDVQNEHDVSLMQDGRRAGTAIVAMVRSWDNLTTRGVRILPDLLLTHNEVIKDEAVSIYGIDPARVTVVGIPHYDKYFSKKPMPREAFLKSIGADPHKPLLLYIPLCDYRLAKNNVDRYMMELLGGLDATTVVRFPPAEIVSIAGYEKKDNVIFDRPGRVFSENVAGDRDLTAEDDDRYLNLLAHANVVIGGPSTAAIDAAVFDTPIVLVDFYPEAVGEEGRIFEYRAEHFVRILQSGGVRRTQSKEEFLSVLQAYLKDPARDREGRARIVFEQCWKRDGRSSERVGAVLLQKIK